MPGKISFSVNKKWCKACGICVALCPKKALQKDEAGKPDMAHEELCIGCGLCEIRCPDFAIRVERVSNTDGKSL